MKRHWGNRTNEASKGMRPIHSCEILPEGFLLPLGHSANAPGVAMPGKRGRLKVPGGTHRAGEGGTAVGDHEY